MSGGPGSTSTRSTPPTQTPHAGWKLLAYLPPTDRARFAEQVTALDVTWIGYEAPGVVTSAAPLAPAPGTGSAFLITRDGHPAGWADPHGDWLHHN